MCSCARAAAARRATEEKLLTYAASQSAGRLLLLREVDALPLEHVQQRLRTLHDLSGQGSQGWALRDLYARAQAQPLARNRLPPGAVAAALVQVLARPHARQVEWPCRIGGAAQGGRTFAYAASVS